MDVVGLRDVGLLPMLSPDLADRRRCLEVLDETRCLVNQFGVCALGAGGQLVKDLIGGACGVAEPLDVEQRGFQRGRQQRLQVAMRDSRLTAPGGCARMAS